MSEFLSSLRPVLGQLKHAVVFSGLLLVVFLCLEWWQGIDRKRYLSRNFLNDVGYMVFYQGGVYQFFVWAPILGFLQAHLSFFRFSLVEGLPVAAPVKYVLYWLVLDFFAYWVHRWQHHSRWFWALHSIHHTQTRPTLLTTYRNHVLDMIANGLLSMIPVLMLGVPKSVWLPFYVFQYVSESAQHSELNWTYGPLYRLVVSPRFHAIHHSTDASHHNRNYGKILSLWDYVFGTFVRAPRPKRYGVDGLTIPETLWGQFIAPFRMMAGAERRRSSLGLP